MTSSRILFENVMLAKPFDVGRIQVGDEPLQHGRLQRAARLEHIGGLCNGWPGNECAAPRIDGHDLIMGQAREHFANARTADAEDVGKTLFGEFGTGRQTMLENRGEDAVVNEVTRDTPGANRRRVAVAAGYVPV